MPSVLPPKKDVQALVDQWKAQGKPRFSELAASTGMDSATLRRWLTVYTVRYDLAPVVQPSKAPSEKAKAEKAKPEPPEIFDRVVTKSNVYVVTSAQNATPVDKNFLAALLVYCKAHKAELIVIPLRYKNPTSVFSDSGEDWWDSSVRPYLCDTRQDLGPNLTLLADIKTQPTAVDPLSGLESISRDKSALVGHPKVALKTVAVPSNKLPKILASTGSVTVANYTDSKAGKKGSFHHSMSAVVIETYGKLFHLRHLHAVPDGSFIDLDKEYTRSGVRAAPPAAALVMGDTHVAFVAHDVLHATLDAPGCLAKRVAPTYFVWHDVLDFYSANHHHKNNPFVAVAKRKSGMDSVEREVKQCFQLLDTYAEKYPNVQHVFPESNHPAAFGRWMKECDWREDLTNAEFYLRTALYMVEQTKMGANGSETPDPFAYWGGVLAKHKARMKFLCAGESFIIKGVDVGSHGHVGPNGSRGSLKGLARIGLRSIIGHSHAPGICEGCYQVGTSSRLKLEYNRGPSSWLQTHSIIYANEKRALIHVIDGAYTNFK